MGSGGCGGWSQGLDLMSIALTVLISLVSLVFAWGGSRTLRRMLRVGLSAAPTFCLTGVAQWPISRIRARGERHFVLGVGA